MISVYIYQCSIHTHIQEYYLAITRDEILWFLATLMDLENVILRKSEKDKYYIFVIWRILKVIQMKSESHSVMSDSLQPHELQHARPPCPSPTPGFYSNSWPSSRWWHPALSTSVIPFFSCPKSFQHQGLFQWVNSSHEVAKVLEFQL